jgi:RHS repeat-associated protein
MIWQGSTYRIIADHLGSPRYVLQATAGTLAEAITYDEFGNALSDTNPGFVPFGFAGGLYDPDTKITRFGTRDYDPQTGRWTSKDSTLFGSGEPNLYDYSLGDPVDFQDPTGRIAIVDDATVAATVETLVAIGLTYELAKAIYEQYQAENRLDDLHRWIESRQVRNSKPVQKHMSCPRPNEPRQQLPRKPPEKPQPPRPAPTMSLNEKARDLLEGLVKWWGATTAGDQGMEDNPVSNGPPDWMP